MSEHVKSKFDARDRGAKSRSRRLFFELPWLPFFGDHAHACPAAPARREGIAT